MAQVVLLVRKATGDEEVSAAGGQLRGVILAQSLPHLSHLGARTAACESAPCAIAAGLREGSTGSSRPFGTVCLTQRCLGTGVRARQERVPFVTCEDGGLLDSAVRPLLGKRVRLQAGAQGVLLSADDSTDASAGAAGSDGTATAAAHPASAERAVTKARSSSVPWSVIALAGGASLPPDKAACQLLI